MTARPAARPDPAPGAREGAAFPGGCGPRLALARALQTTLEVERLIAIFARHGARLVPHDGVEFTASATGPRVRIGERAPHRHVREVRLGGRRLGRVAFSRRHAFTARERRVVERLLEDLRHPLHNALRYHEALRAAARDPLTGLGNRSGLEAALARETALARRHGGALSVLMADLDRFKQVNDRFGHPAGDRVLRAVARCIAGCVRRSDLVFRYGGEEFCVVLGRTGPEGALRLARRVREAVGALRLPAGAGTLRVGVSLGVASWSPGEDAAAVIGKADAALYRAKRAGGDTVRPRSGGAPGPAAPPGGGGPRFGAGRRLRSGTA